MGPKIRIALRYGAGALIAKGVLTPEFNDLVMKAAEDPAVISLVTEAVDWTFTWIGAALATGVEWAYREAKKRGWAT